ncbi:MAG: ATP-binding protein [Oscillospiraceae bacterium]|jgi:DNA replication protein DnaC|nr:ATP-binding protein [Oscillospiraceae bacterium]
MAADRSILARAKRELEQDVSARRRRRELWRERLYGEEPRLRELDKKIQAVFLDALADPSPGAMEAAAGKSLALQREKALLLGEMGATPESLEESPICSACGDTGIAGDGLCDCLKERVRALQAAELSGLLDLRGQSFDSFDAELFSDAFDPECKGSPRQHIEITCELCYSFSRRFGPQSENLLFSGPPGTGKTFLSACVAGAVCERGFSVVYDTAVRQLARMEALQFGRGGEDAERAVERLYQCDLLIIDDLGVEFITPFAQSALQTLINTRLIKNKKMLISTNLARADVRARYWPALASRLEGEFLWLDFFGDDLRQRAR